MSGLVCTDCGQQYKANVGHCRGGPYEGCCSSFDTNRTGDAHRIGDDNDRANPRRCLTVAERLDLGWYQTDRGYWRSPLDDRDAERVRRHHMGQETLVGAPGRTVPGQVDLEYSSPDSATSGRIRISTDSKERG